MWGHGRPPALHPVGCRRLPAGGGCGRITSGETRRRRRHWSAPAPSYGRPFHGLKICRPLAVGVRVPPPAPRKSEEMRCQRQGLIVALKGLPPTLHPRGAPASEVSADEGVVPTGRSPAAQGEASTVVRCAQFKYRTVFACSKGPAGAPVSFLPAPHWGQ